MRRTLPYALLAIALLLGGTAAYFYSQYTKSESSYVSMKATEQNTREQYAQTIDAIAEIQDSLNAITPGSERLQSSSLQSESGMTVPDRRQALERIALLRASIQRNKDRIDKLEHDLKRSGIKVNGLQKMVADLKQSTAEKEQQIATLTSQVNDLQTQVSGLTTQVAQTQDTVRARDESIADKQRELATVYYVADSKAALAKQGVIIAKGGLLGIGKTVYPTGRYDAAALKPLNTDEETTIELPTAKAQVLTPQPPSSYELRQVNGKMELHILSPAEFRKVRNLVIMTA